MRRYCSQSNSFIFLANIFLFQGHTFEFNDYLGPVLCDKKMKPLNRQPGERSKFWKSFDLWKNLPKEEKEKTRIYG